MAINSRGGFNMKRHYLFRKSIPDKNVLNKDHPVNKVGVKKNWPGLKEKPRRSGVFLSG